MGKGEDVKSEEVTGRGGDWEMKRRGEKEKSE
jgi:hypothetical protein